MLGLAALAQPLTAAAASTDPQNALPMVEARTQIFYYPWYGTPNTDGQWVHWQQNSQRPPTTLSSNYVPALGAYSSNNASVVDQHMGWIAQAGVGVVITSWWGQGSYEDRAVPALLDAAARHGLRVAFHIEPYVGRTADSVKSDIAYLYRSYGSHPGFLRVSRPTGAVPSTAPRGVMYVYESLKIGDASWRAMLDSIRNTPLDAFVLAQTSDTRSLSAGHFDGLYTYDVLNQDGSSFRVINDGVVSQGGVFAPSVGPGYIDQRAVGSPRNKPRQNGAVYESMWRRAIDSGAEWITVTSFNEWHEGTQIEPASESPAQGLLSYEGSYGLTGPRSATAYVDETRAMASAFYQAVARASSVAAQPAPPLAQPAPAEVSAPPVQPPAAATATSPEDQPVALVNAFTESEMSDASPVLLEALELSPDSPVTSADPA